MIQCTNDQQYYCFLELLVRWITQSKYEYYSLKLLRLHQQAKDSPLSKCIIIRHMIQINIFTNMLFLIPHSMAWFYHLRRVLNTIALLLPFDPDVLHVRVSHFL